ncbi:hypothetical protein [Silvimonas amylolytica]|uniref:Aldose 1-epimerase n=1 Tax=Silvimonas amylolytica TaxID=449663 RepID=A0ABQ2PHF2_9NEIS|nr:hypothetical protein [Silvimonas amylolytica]GGP24806.1 hypothetical protein GCM10010971_06250 [Silvimonas amylolytica]
MGNLNNPGWTIDWAWGEATVQALGGMLAPVTFELANGQRIQPMQIAPWGDPPDPQWPGVLRQLRGEWPCVPFGMANAPKNTDPAWPKANDANPHDHGYGANHEWQLVHQTSDALLVAINYPAGDPVARLEREIRPDPDSPALTVTLTIHVRQPIRLPVALHPTFAVPQSGLEVIACPVESIHTYPEPTEAGVSRLLPDRSASSLKALPATTGTLDVTRLPLPFATEELLQLRGCKPPFVLRYPGWKAQVELDWDTSQLPDALIWVSNGGRAFAPWSGRHYALGVEPLNSFFDLARVLTPPASHPLADRAGLLIHPGQPAMIRYTLKASNL